MTQTWQDLLFVHYPVQPEILQPNIPNGLTLDMYDQTAWLSLIPFRVKNLRLHYTPALPYLSNYSELNVRTYVRCQGIKGVYFLSLDATKWHPVIGARLLGLPYFRGHVDFGSKQQTYWYRAKRSKPYSFQFNVSYHLNDTSYYPRIGGLDHWLAERYFLWTKQFGHLYEIGIHHDRWKLQQAIAQVDPQIMTPFLSDCSIHTPPKVSYSAYKQAFIWPPVKLN